MPEGELTESERENNKDKAEAMARASDESHTSAEFVRNLFPKQTETLADWNADMEERRAALQYDIKRLSPEQLRDHRQRVNARIEELTTQQRTLFKQPPIPRPSHEHQQHLDAITDLERQLLLLQIERALLEQRSGS